MSQKGALVSSQHTQPDSSRLHRIDLIVHGATGRMGRRVLDLARADTRFRIVATASGKGLKVVEDGSQTPRIEGAQSAQNAQNNASFPPPAHLVIDFSTAGGALAAIDLARSAGAALLTGSTGLAQPTVDALRNFSRDHPTLAAPNTSRGVAVVAKLAAMTAALGSDFEAAIFEAHHSGKKDAPSGTALRLAEAMREAGVDLPDHRIVAVRIGHVIGEHVVRLEGRHESVEIIHRAHSRDLFAAGALAAGEWLVNQPAGWYTMEDVLGFA
jgi:4-hydroxy-tetrahydrodipicolinate reductase